jgi:drug/metabolite transporter (DMT)-like permease
METNPTLSPRLSFLGYAACFAASCLWGTGFYFSRLALNEMSVNYMVLYRILFACLGVLPVALVCRVRFSRKEWRTLLLSAAFGIPISCLLQFGGLARTTVSHASLMVGAMPVMLAVAAALFAPKASTEERLGRLGWLALFASTAGAALISLGGHHGAATHGQPSFTGDLLVLVSLVAALAWILLSKKLMLTHSPSVVSAYTILAGGAMLLPWVMGSWIISPLTHAHVAPACSARPPPRCCGTGGFITCPPRAPGSF